MRRTGRHAKPSDHRAKLAGQLPHSAHAASDQFRWRSGSLATQRTGLRSVRSLRGLWRSLVAHLVRIEGVRGSNPLSSTAGCRWTSPRTASQPRSRFGPADQLVGEYSGHLLGQGPGVTRWTGSVRPTNPAQAAASASVAGTALNGRPSALMPRRGRFPRLAQLHRGLRRK